MRKKNGFTLIELLVTIVLVISVLGIAVVSVMKISEKQKENEYNSIKDQVSTAANQYFSSNEYLFEGVEESGYGIITVEELVKNDYINKLTNPLTGKPLNVCDQIKVTKDENGKFKLSYFEADEYSSTVCSSNSLMIKTHEKAPDLKVYFNDEDDNNDGWFNKNELNGKELEGDAGLFVVIETEAFDIKYCNADSGAKTCALNSTNLVLNSGWESNGKSGYYDKDTFNKEGNIKNVCYVATNESGSVTACIEAGVDINSPSVDLTTYASSDLDNVKNKTASSYNNNWYSGYVGVEALFSDNISTPTITYKRTKDPVLGGSSEKERTNSSGSIYDWSEANGISNYIYEACDEAENCSEKIQQIVKLDRVAPECNTASLSKNAASTGWYNISTGKPTLTLSATDSLSGINGSASNNPTIEAGNKAYSYTFSDKAGNSRICSKTVKYDNTAPSVAINITHDESKWHNTDLSYTVSTSDTISQIGSLKGYWNKSGLTTSDANSADHKWNGNTDHYKTGSSGTANLSKIVNGIYSDGDETKFSAQGHRKLAYIACDNAGNCATSSEKQFKIDKSAPSCNTASLSKNAAATGWYNISTGVPTLTLSATDTFSGIKGSASNNPTITTGDKTYSYTFADNAGNTKTCSKNVKYDNTKPTMTTPQTCCIDSTGSCRGVAEQNYIDNKISYTDTISGLNSTMGYNHCYAYNTSNGSLFCGDYKNSNSTYFTKAEYKYNYSDRSYTNDSYDLRSYETRQSYRYLYLNDYYYLFYKLTDNAGNVSYYRYKMLFDTRTPSSTVQFVSSTNGHNPGNTSMTTSGKNCN